MAQAANADGDPATMEMKNFLGVWSLNEACREGANPDGTYEGVDLESESQ
jgi:hypothetical protein